jgi:hypothetical protein
VSASAATDHGSPAASAAGEVGASSSRPSATSGTSLEAGIDTARFLFRLKDEREQTIAEAGLRYPLDVAGVRVGYTARLEQLWVEGRPAELFGLGTALLPPGGLPDAAAAARGLLGNLGYRSAVEIGVSRVDSTVTLAFPRPVDGFSVLRGMDCLDAPRRITRTFHDGRRLQSVAKLTPRGQVMERVYDKGVERGDDDPGLRVRLEAQNRFKGETRTTAEWWTMERVRETFEKRFAPMARAADGLHVTGEAGVRQLVRQLVDDEKITARQAELLLGHIAAETVGIRRPKRTTMRRRAELRRLGLALALDGLEDDVDVDLAAVLDAALCAPEWSA